MNNEEYFVEKECEIARLGIHIAGGCCGTTPEYIRKLSENSRASVGNAKENDEGIHRAIDKVNVAVKNFDSEIGELMEIVTSTIDNVKLSSDKSNNIQESMLKVAEIADKVQEVIDKTSEILS